ncbi:MAG: exopolysaccharide biosynthesis protein, partial [Gammaproteobacteria bacterium]|nr:exopolysaccharide biosynthesis protein [Gammaproteobacteria bacterium]
MKSFIGTVLGPLLRLKILSLRPPERRWARYLLAAFSGALVIATATALVVTFSPDNYTSRWTLILPGSGSEASLFLQGIGQASSNSASPYASISRSPQVNYREIVASDTVLSLAAEIAEMSSAEFGKPRVKLVQQSSLMSFSISGESAPLAQVKAQAINAALRRTLDRLRSNELSLREQGLRSAMDSYSKRMTNARADLLEH